MDIMGMGSETVALLVKKNLVRTPADLYKLTYEELIQLDGFKERSVLNILDGVEASKSQPFERVLFAIGIRHVGATVAKKLVRHFRAIESLLSANREDLLAAEEIGEVIADQLLATFQKPEWRSEIERLRQYGLNFEVELKEQISDSPISAKKLWLVACLRALAEMSSKNL
jgi:DNA ligase (NAD+)